MTEHDTRTNPVYAGIGILMVVVVAAGFYWLGERLPDPASTMLRPVERAEVADANAPGAPETEEDMAWARAIVHALDEGFRDADQRAEDRSAELMTLVHALEERLDAVEAQTLARAELEAQLVEHIEATDAEPAEGGGISLLDQAIQVVDEQLEQVNDERGEGDANDVVASEAIDHDNRVTLARAQIRTGLFGLLESYRTDVGEYPHTQDGGLLALLIPPHNEDLAWDWEGPYVSGRASLLDPWGKGLFYDCPGDLNTRTYDLASAGPDGDFGTYDDITNWDDWE
jgi:type II secretion system protein G